MVGSGSEEVGEWKWGFSSLAMVFGVWTRCMHHVCNRLMCGLGEMLGY